jgi:hypothetical protein
LMSTPSPAPITVITVTVDPPSPFV